MLLNLGCGEFYAVDWINVDLPDTPHSKDEKFDLRARDLPTHWQAITKVYAGHVLEHLEPHECVALLHRLRHRMTQFGRIMVVGPDVKRAQFMLRNGALSRAEYQMIVNGGHRWSGDEHKWQCHANRVKGMLIAAGWRGADEVELLGIRDWPVVSRVGWQCAVTGRANYK
jgi:predicted SAM-dependent methyltransferase